MEQARMDEARSHAPWIRGRLCAGIVAASLLWAAVATAVVPAVIRGAHAGESLVLFAGVVIGEQQALSVDAYLRAWVWIAWRVTAALVAVGASVVVMAAHRDRVATLRQRALAGLPALTATDVLVGAVWAGVVSGVAETAASIVRLDVLRRAPGEVPGEMLWTAPVAATAAFTAIGSVLVATDRALGTRGRLLALAPPLFVGLAAFGVVRLIGIGVASLAAAVLALGVATLALRAERSHQTLVRRWTRASVPWMVLALAVWAVALPIWRDARRARALASLPAPLRGRPNVLVLIWDAARAPSLSLYGNPRKTTPNLERLARRGVVFDWAFATAPWTLPSHASIFTGRYPHELSARVGRPLDDAHPTLAEVLARHGYATGAFIGNLYFGPGYGLARGFTWYEARAPVGVESVTRSWWLSGALLDRAQTAGQWLGRGKQPLRWRAAQVSDALLRWIDGRGDRPFFAVVNYFDAHDPYLAPAPFNLAFSATQPRYWWGADALHSREKQLQLAEAYETCLLYLDHELGALADALRARGLLDSTLLVVTSDHGEEFGETGDVVGHAGSLNAAALHVPLVILHPARIRSAIRRTDVVSTRDLPATVMDVLGLSDASPFPGAALLREGAAAPAPDGLAAPRLSVVERRPFPGGMPNWPSSRGDMFSLVGGGLHYILDGDRREHLFDLPADPWERRDLVGAAAVEPVLARFRVALDSLVPPVEGVRRAGLP